MATRYYAALLLLVTLPVSAADWYAGASAGGADTSDYCSVDAYADHDISCRRDRSPSFRLYLGHEFNRYLRGEAYFADVGSASVIDRGVSERDTGSISVGGIGVAIMPTLPLGDVDLYLRGGVMRSYTGEHKVIRFGFLFSHSDTVPTYGAGIRYRVSERLSVRAEAEEFHIDSFGAEIDIRTAVVGLEWRL